MATSRRPTPGATLVADIEDAQPSAETPPGLYDRDGTLFALNTVRPRHACSRRSSPLVAGRAQVARSTAAGDADLALAARCRGRARDPRRPRRARPLRPPDAPLRRAAALALRLSRLLLPGADAGARAGRATWQMALAATTKTQLAYVMTGNAELDETSRAGLDGLSIYLADRTALEPGEPAAVDIATDELAFYALLYWPIDPDQPTPSAETMAKVDTFMKNGGTILFDTRDAGGFTHHSGADTPETLKLREILAFVDVPPLEPVPPDHVLTKAFYLLTDFPGRWANSDSGSRASPTQPQDPNRPARGGDGVSPILITGNDFAAAWAIDEDGLWLYPTVPADPRQRELAFRAGVNIVMYSLTGNYKADQVHVPALLERLGQ